MALGAYANDERRDRVLDIVVSPLLQTGLRCARYVELIVLAAKPLIYLQG